MTSSHLLIVGDAAPDLTLPDELGQPVRLSDRWHRGPIALVFVRHSGCTLCRGHADALRNYYSEIQAAGGDVVLVTMNPIDRLADFKRRLDLPFTCLADPNETAYEAYQSPRGSLWAVAGPAMWGRAIQNLLRHGFGQPIGDMRRLPSSFIIDQSGTIRFVHRGINSADWASPEELIRVFHQLPE